MWFTRSNRAPERSSAPKQTKRRGGPRAAAGLVALIGAFAAGFLLESVPEEESGRKVEATVTAEGDAKVRHISGRQYLKTYLDIAGIPTACDGITRGIKRGQRFTEEQCTEKLIEEIEIHARGALRCAPSLKRAGRDYQRIAVVSLTFNIGVGGFCGSSARRQFEAGNIERGCERMLPWNKARVRGRLRPVRGLINRRNREYQICVTGIKPGHTARNLNARLERWK